MKFDKKNTQMRMGWIVISIIAVVPIILWYTAPAYPPRFSGLEIAIANLGQIFGLVGLVLISMNFVLSIDAKWLEKVFLGLNDVYKKHGLFGKMGFAMLMLHPLLLLNKFTELTFVGITGFLLPGKEWDINFGIFALWLMAVLIILTLYLRPKYHIWKNTHKFMGLVLILAGFHVWLIPATVSYYKPLRYYMLAVLAAGVTAFVYKTLLGWLLQPKHILTVSDVKKMNEQITEITLTPQKRFTYQAGQFLIISFLDKEIGKESHPFSIVSAPDEDVIRLAIKNLGDYTSRIQQLKPGARAKAHGPFGIFNYTIADSKKQIWIAGGIGITPFVSMAEDLSKTGKDYEIDLFYAVNKMEDAVYLERLKEIASQIPQKFRLFPIFNNEGQSISADSVLLKSDGFDGKRIFLCGPPKMIKTLNDGLIKFGVLKSSIRSEEFSL